MVKRPVLPLRQLALPLLICTLTAALILLPALVVAPTGNSSAAGPTAAFSATSTNGTGPLAVQFTDQSSSSITSWLWDFGDGQTSAEQNPQHTYTAKGLYAVSLKVTDASSSDTARKVDYIGVSVDLVTRDTTLPAGWNMISFPLAPNSPDFSAVLGDDIPAGLYLFWYDPTIGSYRTWSVGNKSFPAERGRGYWLKTSSPTPVDDDGHEDSGKPFVIHLKPGWNMIGHPLEFGVGWKDVLVSYQGAIVSITQAHDNNWVLKYLYEWDTATGGYKMWTAPDGKLDPWKGYWVRAFVEPDLIVPIPPSRSLRANGLAYGPFRDGQSPDYRIFPTTEQIKEDLEFIRQLTGRIRTYGTAGTLQNIPKLASDLGIKVDQGIYLSKDIEANEAEIARGVKLAQDGLIESLVVGNESITLSLLSKEDLISYLKRVKNAVPSNVRITTAEFWSVWRDNPDLVKEVDFVLAHFHPFWEKHTIEGAATHVVREYRELLSKLKSEYPGQKIEIVVGETGWPTGGTPLAEDVVPSGQNQRRFIKEFMTLASLYSIPYYYFDAFDEEWKWQEGSSGTGDMAQLPLDRTFSGRWVGSSWGVFQSDGKLKPDLTGLFEQPTLGSRLQRDVFVDGQLATYYDIGVNSSGGRHDWISKVGDSLRMSYPDGQQGGAVFITVGTPSGSPRPWKDFSQFSKISVDLKGEVGGESVQIGMKDSSDPDNGTESKKQVDNLSTDWRTYVIGLNEFITADLRQLYVVVELVFSGSIAETVYFRNVRYLP